MNGAEDEDRGDAPVAGHPPAAEPPSAGAPARAPEPGLVADELEGHDTGTMTSAGRRRTGGLLGRVRSMFGR